ncbi:MAG TPA: zf-HC2 domain-containing protein [Bryobacteraceae bacterium]|nr:zf-HC2 domain-containing protein [Bryobacteraceae bacterium]
MNSATHPDAELLLRLADEDLSTEETRRVEQHLSACPACRDELAALRDTSEDILRFHQTVLKPALPEPPRAWELPRRIPSAPRVIAFPIKRVLTAAAALIAAVVLVRRMEQPVPVSAAELLRKAEVRERAAPNPRRRIRIRYRNRSWTRPARLDTLRPPEAGDPAVIDAMLRQAGFSTEDPLSAAAFSRWRSGLSARQDQVRQDSENYVVTTSTPEGVVREASLTLRSGDLHPTSATLRYRSEETVDMDEVPADAVELEGPRPPVPPPAPRRAQAPAVPAAGPAEEVQVMAALHRIGADLGEPVDVARNAGSIDVSGAGLAPARQEQIRAALTDIPGVRIAFESGGARRANGAGLPRRPAAPADAANPLIDQLRAASNGAADPGDSLIEATDRAVQRAYALAALAQRFPAPLEASLAPADRTLVRRMALDHADILSASVTAMNTLLTAVLPPANVAPPAGAGWQQTAETVLAAARGADQAINAATADLDARKTRLAVSLARLRGLIEILRTELQ